MDAIHQISGVILENLFFCFLAEKSKDPFPPAFPRLRERDQEEVKSAMTHGRYYRKYKTLPLRVKDRAAPFCSVQDKAPSILCKNHTISSPSFVTY